MNPIVASLLEFNQAFEIPKLDAPGLGPNELIELRIKLLTEEVQEYAEAARAGDRETVEAGEAYLDDPEAGWAADIIDEALVKQSRRQAVVGGVPVAPLAVWWRAPCALAGCRTPERSDELGTWQHIQERTTQPC